MPDTSIELLIVFVMLYLAFLFWYGGRSKPLSQAEVENTQVFLVNPLLHMAFIRVVVAALLLALAKIALF